MIDQVAEKFDARLAVEDESMSRPGEVGPPIRPMSIENQTVRRANLFLKGLRLWLALAWVVGALVAGSTVARADGPVARPDRKIPVRLRIPAIDLDSEIVSVAVQIITLNGRKYRQWETSPTLVGWQQGSALLGQRGNTVLSGHSDSYSQVFRDLNQVQVGDEIMVFAATQVRHYQVTQVVEVQETGVSMAQRVENGKWIRRTDDERLTLVTCSQPGASHRLIIVAYPVRSSYPIDDLRLRQLK